MAGQSKLPEDIPWRIPAGLVGQCSDLLGKPLQAPGTRQDNTAVQEIGHKMRIYISFISGRQTPSIWQYWTGIDQYPARPPPLHLPFHFHLRIGPSLAHPWSCASPGRRQSIRPSSVASGIGCGWVPAAGESGVSAGPFLLRFLLANQGIQEIKWRFYL